MFDTESKPDEFNGQEPSASVDADCIFFQGLFFDIQNNSSSIKTSYN